MQIFVFLIVFLFFFFGPTIVEQQTVIHKWRRGLSQPLPYSIASHRRRDNNNAPGRGVDWDNFLQTNRFLFYAHNRALKINNRLSDSEIALQCPWYVKELSCDELEDLIYINVVGGT